jgi:hypothetical protein
MAGVVGLGNADEDLQAAPKQNAAQAPEEISPAKDLTREHGILNRILLIYEESGRRLRGK